jgi:hypothetical protein
MRIMDAPKSKGYSIHNLEIDIGYKKLYFDDLVYVLHSLKTATQKFYDSDEYWFDEIDKVLDRVLGHSRGKVKS